MQNPLGRGERADERRLAEAGLATHEDESASLVAPLFELRKQIVRSSNSVMAVLS